MGETRQKELTAKDPHYRARIAADFARQGAMTSIGGALDRIEPGLVELTVPLSDKVSQQHGFMHGGMVATGLDTACGFAAISLLPAGVQMLTVEFKTNFLAPAQGERYLFRGRVLKPGRTLSVCEGEAFAIRDGDTRLVATMTATLMALAPRDAA